MKLSFIYLIQLLFLLSFLYCETGTNTLPADTSKSYAGAWKCIITKFCRYENGNLINNEIPQYIDTSLILKIDKDSIYHFETFKDGDKVSYIKACKKFILSNDTLTGDGFTKIESESTFYESYITTISLVTDTLVLLEKELEGSSTKNVENILERSFIKYTGLLPPKNWENVSCLQ